MSQPLSQPDAYDRLRTLVESVPDGRKARGLRHPLPDVLFIMLVAVLAGHGDAEAIADFAEDNEDWFKKRCGLRYGTPSQDTFLRVLAAMDPDAFEEVFRKWVGELWEVSGTEHVAIDGKSLRRSFDRAANLSPIHSVAAYASDLGLVLGCVPVEEKENEITAIPRLLKLIDVKGATVTIDAMGCQTAIAAAIHEAGGHYLLAVKGNHPTLRRQMGAYFADSDRTERPPCDPAPDIDSASVVEKGHGRLEKRRCEVSKQTDWVDGRAEWAGLACLVRITRERETLSDGKVSTEVAYFISNDPKLTATRAMSLVRRHWEIENSLHWVLDVVFDEDLCRVRNRKAAKNFAVIRRAATNLLKNAPSPRKRQAKVSVARRRASFARSDAYRDVVLRLKPC